MKLFAVNSSVYTNVEVAPPQKPLRKGEREHRQTNSGKGHSGGGGGGGGGDPRASKDPKGDRKDKDKDRERPNGRLAANAANGRANGVANGVANGPAPAGSGAATDNGVVGDPQPPPAEDGTSELRAGSRANGEGTVTSNGKGHVDFSL